MSGLPKNWAWSTLENLSATAPRSMTDGPFGSNLKTVHYTDSGPRVIRLQNIGDGVFNDVEAHISSEHYASLTSHSVEAGDLVVASLGTDLPRACLVPESVPPAIVKADCIRVRLHREIDAKFVNFALQRPELRRKTQDEIHGVGRPRIGMAGVKAFTVPVPPLPEQRRIVAAVEEHLSRLDAADAALVDATRRIESVLLSTLAGEFGRDAADGPALVDCLSASIGGVWGDPAGEGECDVDVMRVTEFRNDGSLHPATAARRSISLKQLASRELRLGDLLLEKSGGGPTQPVGRVVRVPKLGGAAVPTNFVQLMRPSAEIVSDYLFWQLWWWHASGVADGYQRATTNIRNLQTKDYLARPVRRPPIDHQLRFANAVDELRDQLDQVRKSIDLASARSAFLSRSVLAAAFSGQLVPQDPFDEPASVLLERIAAERAESKPSPKKRAKS